MTVWVLCEDWCSERDYTPFRYFESKDAGVRWVSENPPQEFQDFWLYSIPADGLPRPDWNSSSPTKGEGVAFPGDIEWVYRHHPDRKRNR